MGVCGQGIANAESPALSVVASCFLNDARDEVRRYIHESQAPAMRSLGDRSLVFQTLSLSLVTWGALTSVIVWLRGVLVPFTLAGVLTFLLEPLLFWLLGLSRMLRAGTGTTTRCGRVREVLAMLWSGVAVALCILSVAVIVGTVAFLFFSSINSLDFGKYAGSPKLHALMSTFARIQSEKGLPMQVLLAVVNFVLDSASRLFLMVLFLAFMLIGLIGSLSKHGAQRRSIGVAPTLRNALQRFVWIRLLVSAFVGLNLWWIYAVLEVDMAFLFALLAFLLNHIPHIGSLISVVLPLPLVLLDPTKSYGDLVSCAWWPLLVHAIVGSVIDPKLTIDGLDLHPVAVLMALVFWMVCWGFSGAILSIPLTCVLRALLLQVDTPMARALVCILGGRLPEVHEKAG